MPLNDSDSMLKVIGTGLAVIGVCSVPALSSTVSRLTRRDVHQDTYEDGDGKASLESLKAYSAKLPKSFAVVSAGSGFAISIALLVISAPAAERGPLTNSLGTAAWALLLFQAFALASSRSSVHAYNLGIYLFFSAALLAGILLSQGTTIGGSLLHSAPVPLTLRVVELVSGISLAISALCIPRRPDVFYQGELVDRTRTASAFSRFTWSWASNLPDLASKKNDLDLLDLPRPDRFFRAAAVSASWKVQKTAGKRLWLALLWAHIKPLALQWFFTFVSSVLNFGPQWVILQLLRYLEARELGSGRDMEAWMWVFWLGVTMISQGWVETYVWWLACADLQIPVRAQLSALIFEKSMRRKDVKGADKTKKKGLEEGNTESSGASTAPDRPEAGVEEDKSKELMKSKQSTVNLIGVDAKRVSDFFQYQNLFPASFFKLVVSLAFLIDLLGWKALLAGFSAMIAIMPINIYFSQKYSAAQDRLMEVRDEKMGVVTEALQGIRQIKFSALEPEWEAKIGAVRERELSAVWDVFKNDTMLIGCWVTSPLLLSAFSLAVYASIYGSLAPSVAFVSLGIFKSLEMTLSVVPELTTDLLDAWVSLDRIEQYLNSPELEVNSKQSDEVAFEDTSIAWPTDEDVDESERFVLRNINVTFPKGELSVISGKTGTGKSLMLAAILGEVDVLAGALYVPRAPPLSERHDDKANKGNWIIPNAIAYVAQIPWIENASIKDNIVFGLPFDEERYNKTIEVCALTKDLEMLDDGENTEIGANGINLSGGQKWRVTLARAVYSRAGILVLDDIFSAVDAHVGRHIFEKCLNGELAVGRTRILVTHHVALCEAKAKFLMELGNGGVLHAGLLSELREEGMLQKIRSHEQTADEIEADELTTAVNSEDSSVGERDQDGGNPAAPNKAPYKAPEARKFVEEEARERGAVKMHVYWTYLKDSGGFIFWAFALCIYLLVQVLNIGRSWWLKIWTGNYEEQGADQQLSLNGSTAYGYSYTEGIRQSIHVMSAPSPSIQSSLFFYLSVYITLAVISSIIGTLKYLYVYFGSIRASRSLFAKLNFTVLRTPTRWLDTVPLGRILNRYTADFNTIDSELANAVSFGSNSFLSLMAVIVAGLFVSPYIVFFALILLLICLYYAIRYLHVARPVKRLESTTKSPVFEQFGSALTGVATIRAFGKAPVYVDRMHRKIDDYSTSTWHLWLFNRWMGWRMSLVGSFFSVFVSVLVLLTPGIDSALAGFALAFALDFSSSVMWTIRLYATVELNMNAAERIIEYTELPTESLGGQSPPAAWPTEGRIEVNDLVVAYAPDLPPVLKGLTFSVNRNERVGVVGRTGAGKSSLTLALFRFLEARSGSIYIDGLDVSQIKLHDLRSRLAIIPQDPVLFSGTIRSNLDPFDHHTDEELRDCLERVHLVNSDTTTASSSGSITPVGSITPKNTNPFSDLSSPVSEGGLNLSQGQRQLLCLARAIVSRPRVMVLDEATSAVDMHTDALIQRSIREEFTDATLLVIAHRLSTIADFDRVLVLSDGQVAEFGTPRELWEKGDAGIFRSMCEESGEREKLRGIVYGEK